ncbi:MAG: hypothetical protein AB7O45_16045 [Alphaproteobacteria bacterium]
MARAVRAIVEERERQLGVEGFTAEGDDALPPWTLAQMASCYAAPPWWRFVDGAEADAERRPQWPISTRQWKPRSDRRDLVRAAALIVAEIERIDRAEERQRGDDVPPGAVLAELKAGDVLVADARFTCIDAGARVTVEATERGALFVACADGRHLLDGQVDAHGRLRGLSLAPSGDAP